MIAIEAALKEGDALLEASSDSPHRDSLILLSYLLQKEIVFLYTYPEYRLNKETYEAFKALLARRLMGEPIAYILGAREFWSLPLKVTKDTLIPRPETELLVELALEELKGKKELRILDLGTGTGAIALALAFEKPDWKITAVDRSLEALSIAQYNAKSLALNNIQFCCSDWFQDLDKDLKFDAIVSNPPYLAADDHHLNQGDLRFEPKLALIAPKQGLESLEIIIANSLARLVPDGLLLVEHGYMQKVAVSSMLYDYGYDKISAWQDYQGRDRVSGGRKLA